MAHQFSITTTWNGQQLPPADHISITLTPCPDKQVVLMDIDAPLYNSPAAPSRPAGEACPQLWDYEVVEMFFLGAEERYLEVEFGPHGHHLLLLLAGRRNMCRDQLPVVYTSKKSDGRWTGRAEIPFSYFPPGVDKVNAYAIHGEGDERTYKAMYPATGQHAEPDFHRLEYFRPLDAAGLCGPNDQLADVWKS
eukprot:m.145047 g.145047  ORF g.145047 m.145047 type:complete len:193 (-) comp20482_c1_seq4:36-614(-)